MKVSFYSAFIKRLSEKLKPLGFSRKGKIIVNIAKTHIVVIFTEKSNYSNAISVYVGLYLIIDDSTLISSLNLSRDYHIYINLRDLTDNKEIYSQVLQNEGQFDFESTSEYVFETILNSDLWKNLGITSDFSKIKDFFEKNILYNDSYYFNMITRKDLHNALVSRASNG